MNVRDNEVFTPADLINAGLCFPLSIHSSNESVVTIHGSDKSTLQKSPERICRHSDRVVSPVNVPDSKFVTYTRTMVVCVPLKHRKDQTSVRFLHSVFLRKLITSDLLKHHTAVLPAVVWMLKPVIYLTAEEDGRSYRAGKCRVNEKVISEAKVKLDTKVISYIVEPDKIHLVTLVQTRFSFYRRIAHSRSLEHDDANHAL